MQSTPRAYTIISLLSRLFATSSSSSVSIFSPTTSHARVSFQHTFLIHFQTICLVKSLPLLFLKNMHSDCPLAAGAYHLNFSGVLGRTRIKNVFKSQARVVLVASLATAQHVTVSTTRPHIHYKRTIFRSLGLWIKYIMEILQSVHVSNFCPSSISLFIISFF